MAKIIIVGGMASGKTTAANYFVLTRGYTKLSLADPIKNMELNLDYNSSKDIVEQSLPQGLLNDYEKKIMIEILDEARKIFREHPKPRKRLQFIGTDGARIRIRPTIWIECAALLAKNLSNVVIDDVRFKNEFTYFHEQGWSSIGLYVSPEKQQERILQLYGEYDPKILEHPSEVDIIHIIRNEPITLKIDTTEKTPKLLHEELALWEL